MSRCRTELPDQLGETTFADSGGADHRREIATEIAGVADVEHEHLVDVLAALALIVELERRNAQPFLPDFGRARIVGSVRGAADVALVGPVDRPEHVPATVEDRHKGREIRQMIATAVRVVEQVDITRPDLALEECADCAGGERQCADVDRHMFCLRDQAAIGVT